MSIHDKLLDQLSKALKQQEMKLLIPHLGGIMDTAVQQVTEDLLTYALRDPASKGRIDLILASYASFKVVLYYRLAHQIWTLEAVPCSARELIAQRLSNKGKIVSGVEIHPAARIGRRFVVDHGFGTVIGETCEIGNDCYLLNGVILGASGIANNPSGKRHPRLGNNVEVGAGARILGPVVIGDDVFISPACVITHDVPANTKVRIVNQLQVQKSSASGREGFFSAFALDGRLHLVGELTEPCDIVVLDADHCRLSNLVIECTVSGQNHAQYRVHKCAATFTAPRFPLNLRVSGPDQEVILLNPPGLGALVLSLR